MQLMLGFFGYRLTPAYMMMVGILVLNSNWYARTSQFHMEERPHETCEKYWWRNLLYINNLFGRETMVNGKLHKLRII